MTNAQRSTGAFTTVTALFFAWGLITALIDPLVAAVKSIFALSNVEAQLSAFAFFIACGLIVRAATAAQSRGGNLTLGSFSGLIAEPVGSGIADFIAQSPQVGAKVG